MALSNESDQTETLQDQGFFDGHHHEYCLDEREANRLCNHFQIHSRDYR